jgi:hypothetical protein
MASLPTELFCHSVTVCCVAERGDEREYIVFSNTSLKRVKGSLRGFIRHEFPEYEQVSLGGFVRFNQMKDRMVAQWMRHVVEPTLCEEEMEVAPLPTLKDFEHIPPGQLAFGDLSSVR